MTVYPPPLPPGQHSFTETLEFNHNVHLIGSLKAIQGVGGVPCAHAVFSISTSFV